MLDKLQNPLALAGRLLLASLLLPTRLTAAPSWTSNIEAADAVRMLHACARSRPSTLTQLPT